MPRGIGQGESGVRQDRLSYLSAAQRAAKDGQRADEMYIGRGAYCGLVVDDEGNAVTAMSTIRTTLNENGSVARALLGQVSSRRASCSASQRIRLQLIAADEAWPSRHSICPFLIMCIVSMPAMSARAQRKDLKPSIGRTACSKKQRAAA